MNKKYDLILFDMDGTLADTDPMIIESFHVLYDKYNHGIRRPDSEVVYFSGPPIRETLLKEFPNENIDEVFEDFRKISRSLYDTHTYQYPHCKEVLHKLKKEGFKLGVVTNKMHDLTLVVLKILELDDVFDVVVGFDDVGIPKPNPSGILKAANVCNINPSRVLYVGDILTDYLTAKNANVDSCIVNWGPRILSEEAHPNFRIKSYLELEGHLYE